MSSSAVLRRSAAERTAVLAFAAGILLAGPRMAMAGFCGDDVGGVRVPCACGDQVVSDTTLAASDPVTTAPCTGDGLLLWAPRDVEGITLNLNGLSIVGTGTGVGIRAVRGGQSGSSIIGGGTAGGAAGEIANFRTGISGSGRSVLAEVSNLYIHNNVGDGMRVQSPGVQIVDVVSENNGRDGVSVVGRNVALDGVVSGGNASDGVQVRGHDAKVVADSAGNGRHGLVVSGSGHRVDESATGGNGGAGLVTSGKDVSVGRLAIGDNGQGDVKDHAKSVSGAAR